MYFKRKISKSSVLPQKIRLLFHDAQFIKAIDDYRDEFGVPKNGFNSLDKMQEWLNKKIKESKNQDPDEIKNPIKSAGHLAKKFDLPAAYNYFIYYYCTCNIIAINLIDDPYIIVTQEEDDNGFPVINIQMSSNTRQIHIKSIWKEVIKIQKKISSKKKNTSFIDLERDSRILELKGEGKSYKDIKKIINKEFPNNKIQDWSYIGQRLSRINKRIYNK